MRNFAEHPWGISLSGITTRFESTTEQITQLESEFLYRRRGEDEELSSIYPGLTGKAAQEVGYRDDFVDHYMGKVYGRREPIWESSSTYPVDGGHNYELLSTGVEGLFGGRYGGLVGIHANSAYHADEEMRAFVLGVMATADRSDSPPEPAAAERDVERTSEPAHGAERISEFG